MNDILFMIIFGIKNLRYIALLILDLIKVFIYLIKLNLIELFFFFFKSVFLSKLRFDIV